MTTINRPALDQHNGPVDISREFPILDSGHYVNHAAISPWPRRSSEVARQFASENATSGAQNYMQWLKTLAQLRERVAVLIGAASGDDIALLANTSSGINLVARGLDWQTGDNVVLPLDEFPSNFLPWKALEDKGVEIRQCNIRACSDPEEALLSKLDQRTKLLALSSVQWTDGLRLDLDRLGAQCRETGVFLFVDAIQQLGALQVNVRRSGVDFLSAGCHKWQMGPEGAGIFYCRPELRSSLRPHSHGWRMLQTPFDFDHPDQPMAEAARRFESGTGNTLGQLVLNASLSLLEEIGMDVVEQRVLANSKQLMAGLQQIKRLSLASQADPGRISGIISFEPHTLTSAEFALELGQRGVTAVNRGKLIRLSPHFYQGEDQINAVLNAVEAVSSANN